MKTILRCRGAGETFLLACSLLLTFAGGTAYAQQRSAAKAKPAPEEAKKASVVTSEVILVQPGAPYTAQARQHRVEGVVRLNVTLKATGQVGLVTPLTYLPYGLTERAIAAAKNIRFRPRLIMGEPVDVVVPVTYRFRLYYENDDKEITQKVRIYRTPKPLIDRNELPSSTGGSVLVDVFFSSDGEASVFKYVTRIPDPLAQKIADAVAQIQFRPAVHLSGRKMNVTKVVIYKF